MSNVSTRKRKVSSGKSTERRSKKRKTARDAEDEENDTEIEDEEAEEDDSIGELAGQNTEQVALRLCSELESKEVSEEVRQEAEFFIKFYYLNNGGSPINTNDPIRFDFKKCSNEELKHILENMIIYSKRTKQRTISDNAITAVSNLTYILGGKDQKLFESIHSDDVLRDALFQTLMGSRFSPLFTLLTTATARVSTVIKSYLDKRNVVNVPDPNSKNPQSKS